MPKTVPLSDTLVAEIPDEPEGSVVLTEHTPEGAALGSVSLRPPELVALLGEIAVLYGADVQGKVIEFTVISTDTSAEVELL